MKKCENIKCSKEHDGSFGSGRFCSRSCSNAHVVSDKTKSKISKSVKKRLEKEGVWGCIPEDDEGRQKIGKAVMEAANKKIMKSDWSSLSYERQRKRIIMEQDKKCSKCGLDQWLEQYLCLEIDHINGNNTDNRRENMEALCPNCHSITPTWRGKNRAKKNGNLSGIEIYKLYLKCGNIHKTLLEMGMAAKGANYNRIKKVIKRYEGIYK